ncbi:MAG TPA: hypothetical protein VFC47_08215, partial [Caulobacteraceae bacterium]|nr:hypothetical protein [Caulobacteraceae bacterium]
MTRVRLAGVLAAAAALAGCGPRDPTAIAGARTPVPTASERAYHAPPTVTSVRRLASGAVVVAGEAIGG